MVFLDSRLHRETSMRIPLLLAGLLIALAPAALVGQVAPHGESEPVLRAGDAVRIAVWRNEELSGEFDIAADGAIRHPLYREIRVAGLTPEEAESRLREFLLRYEASPQFVMEPLFRVAVGGEVRLPDLYALAPETTIGQAVAMAGGATAQGELDTVILIRDGRRWTLDLTEPAEGVASLPVRSGDQILVSRRSNWLRDYVAPVASILAAVGVFLNYATR